MRSVTRKVETSSKNFVVEPVREPPHLDARAGIGRQQPALAEFGAARLVEIFGDDHRARHRRMAFLDQHRRRAVGIEREKFLAPLPHALLDQPRRDAELAERQTHEARMRTERMMKQRDHCALDSSLRSWPTLDNTPDGTAATFSVAP